MMRQTAAFVFVALFFAALGVMTYMARLVEPTLQLNLDSVYNEGLRGI
jgi:hypothetical protein